jgi:hypothetical protein
VHLVSRLGIGLNNMTSGAYMYTTFQSFPFAVAFVTLFLSSLLVTCDSWAEHTIYLRDSNTIPSYCQQDQDWCGAAVGQMILEGYPAAEHPFDQPGIWQKIESNRDDSTVAWLTDPEGLQRTLMQLGGDSNVNWSVLNDTDASRLMHSIGYWMTKNQFPVAAMVDPTGASIYGSFQHWVVIEGFVTDLDPVTNQVIELKSVDIVNPAPPCGTDINRGGIRSTVDSATWYSFYWRVPGNYAGSKWDGNYVAVVEPPLTSGVSKAPKKALLEQGSVISKNKALELAAKWLKTMSFDNKYPVLKNVIVSNALLVNETFRGYYLVPLIDKSQKDNVGAIIINAYNGDFEEIGVFQKPIQFLDVKAAIQIALKECSCGEAKMARLVVHPLLRSQSRYIPIWKIIFKFRTVYVSQTGIVIQPPLGPGD